MSKSCSTCLHQQVCKVYDSFTKEVVAKGIVKGIDISIKPSADSTYCDSYLSRELLDSSKVAEVPDEVEKSTRKSKYKEDYDVYGLQLQYRLKGLEDRGFKHQITPTASVGEVLHNLMLTLWNHTNDHEMPSIILMSTDLFMCLARDIENVKCKQSLIDNGSHIEFICEFGITGILCVEGIEATDLYFVQEGDEFYDK